jgi:polar amino acid transport system substrate-binding protein
MRRRATLIATVCTVVALAFVLAVAGGCKPKAQQPTVQPKVAPPVIGEAGALRVGVDLDYPPFAGQDNGQKVGIDVDVASALAEKLGLKVALVDVKPSDAATALADGSVDIVMSVPLEQTTDGKIGYAGTYINTAPVLFAKVASASVEPTLTIAKLGTTQIAAQYASPAFWYLQEQLGEQYVKGFATLEEPLTQLAQGTLKYVAGDAIVGGYIARDLGEVKMVGQLKPATLIGIGVRADNTELQDAVRAQVDALAADGVLSTIRAKWVADLPKLELPKGAETTSTP